ncbi:ATP-binding protein [Aquisalimonas sp.]|uniref:ATP-binding protein n=1 Tax=Aquisalimonas sp. TaxID=1872621 RepID=UPI0025BBE7D4|nr:ATP-binding protein [Aquisalimonas sp.]
MDPITNPYTPNAGSKPPELAGRGKQLRQFEVLIGRLSAGLTEQSMIIRGLRGVGKTVLLNAFEDIAESAGFITFYHELTPESSLIAQVARDAESTLAQLKLTSRVAARLRDSLAHLKTIRIASPEGFELAVDLRGGDEGQVSADLAHLLVQIGKAAQEQGRGVVLLIDDVQFAAELEYRALISALHRATQKSLPVTLAAAGLPQIPRLTGEARSYAERLFDFPTLDSLAHDDAAAALASPARQHEVSYTPEAVQRAITWTGGYPFFIQQLGKHAWNLAGQSPIDLDAIEDAMPVAREALDRSIYEVRLQRATETERRYMKAMAELGTGPYRSGDVARKLGKGTGGVSKIRQRLLDKGLVYATEDFGYIDFTVPRFDDFMRRRNDIGA